MRPWSPTTVGPAVAWPGTDALPVLAFVMFQLMFAIITPALISGAIADRAKFWGWTLFVVVWVTVVYFPVAHWVFSFNGFIGENAVGGWIANNLKALDFAGGTAVHINAGAAGLALAIVLGKRKGWPKDTGRPHNVPFVLLGASLLWFGWYGFNAGSALAANDLAASLGCELTAAGTIVIDGDGRTNVPGVYAAGDAATEHSRSVANAIGSGSRAAYAVALALV